MKRIIELLKEHNIKPNNIMLRDISNFSIYMRENYFLDKSNIIQKGGDKIIYNNNMQIAFYVTKDERGKIYTLHMNNQEENLASRAFARRGLLECLMFTLSKNMAEINIINNDQNCKSMDDLYTMSGKALLKIALTFIKSVKDKYNIKRIILNDTSKKKCNNKTINLPIFYSLMYGHTWYGKYGFRPYDITHESPDKKMIDVYNKNVKIMDSITLKEIPSLSKYFIEFFKKQNNRLQNKVNDKDIINILDTIKKSPNTKLCDFMKSIFKYYDKTCELIYHFYMDLYIDIGCYNFTNQFFYLDI